MMSSCVSVVLSTVSVVRCTNIFVCIHSLIDTTRMYSYSDMYIEIRRCVCVAASRRNCYWKNQRCVWIVFHYRMLHISVYTGKVVASLSVSLSLSLSLPLVNRLTNVKRNVMFVLTSQMTSYRHLHFDRSRYHFHFQQTWKKFELIINLMFRKLIFPRQVKHRNVNKWPFSNF